MATSFRAQEQRTRWSVAVVTFLFTRLPPGSTTEKSGFALNSASGWVNLRLTSGTSK
jgi:hypothetical protein